jgi:lysophospholipase L1-like esterase
LIERLCPEVGLAILGQPRLSEGAQPYLVSAIDSVIHLGSVIPTPMKTLPLLLVLASLSLFAADAPNVAPAEKVAVKAKAKAKAKAPNPAMTPIADVAGLPRVLLIGDSISIGYTLPVRQELAGKANVHRIPTNGGPTKNGTANLAKWLGEGKWDVIHFNFGLHDLRHMEDGKRQVEPADYEKNLRSLVADLKKTGAKLIFATTTPVPEGKLTPQRTFGDVATYNDIALKVMKENGVAIDDLNAAVAPDIAKLQNKADVHFNTEGSAVLGKAVVKSINAALGK